ncbi:kinase-like domain-containing protein [Xylaria sp. FL0043]|nr:kinase-like domain-containing protein [Xylaria sp. FL0043]
MASDFVPKQSPKDLSADDSQGSTQEHPQGHAEARLEASRTAARLGADQPSTPLDWTKSIRGPKPPELKSARILVYPKVEGLRIFPYKGTGDIGPWIDVNMGNKAYSARVLVVTSGRHDIGCMAAYQDSVCYFFFDPEHDRVTFFNQSLSPFSVSKLGEQALYPIPTFKGSTLPVGIWDLHFDGESLMEVQVLKRRDWLTQSCVSSKRAAPADETPSKRRQLPDGRSVLRNSQPAATSDNSLVKLEKGTKICVGSKEDCYWLTHLGTISKNNRTTTWRAKHSSFPDGDIVVKVSTASRDDGRLVLYMAKRLMREYTIHSRLDHPSIAKLLGMDARFHSLYIEHIDAKPLSAQVDPNTCFAGTHADALKIMENLASALSHVHSKSVVHGNIKPGNILYNHTRGAVLIDFGLSFQVSNTVTSIGCGTPWYLPPEFTRTGKHSGPESDIWALGIVMLWLLGYIGLPERNYHPWPVEDMIPGRTASDSRERAMKHMGDWIDYIAHIRANYLLPGGGDLERIVNKTLQVDEEARINAASLSEQLRALRITAAGQEGSPNPTLQNQSRDDTSHHGDAAGGSSAHRRSDNGSPPKDVAYIKSEPASP